MSHGFVIPLRSHAVINIPLPSENRFKISVNEKPDAKEYSRIQSASFLIKTIELGNINLQIILI